METLLCVAWIDRVVHALAEVFYHAMASLNTVSCRLSGSAWQSEWPVLLSALMLAALTLASIAALETE